MKTYVVPLIIEYTFGADVLVTAESPEDAKQKALEGSYDNPDGLDWDRAEERGRRLGHWAKIVEDET